MFKKLRKNALVSSSAIYLGANMLNAAIPFVIMPIMTRYLSPTEYGEVAMFQTLLAVLVAMGGLGVVGSAARKYYDDRDPQSGRYDLGEYIGTCVQILLASSVVMALVVLALNERVGDWLGLTPMWALAAVLVCAALVMGQLRLGQWQVRRDPRRYGTFQVSRSILNMALSLVFVVLLNHGAAGRIDAQIISAVVFAGVAVISLRRDGVLKFITWRPDFVKEALRFGVPLLPHALGTLLLASMDRFVIKSDLGLASAGIYMVAVQLASGVGLIVDAVNKAMVPWLYERLKRNDDADKRRIVRYTYLWYLVMLLVALLAFLVGPWVVTIVAGQRYSEAGDVIGLLVLSQVFGGVFTSVSIYSHYAKRTGMLSVATLVSGALNVLLLLVLVSRMGIVGAAIAQCIGMGVRFLLAWWIAQRRHPMPWF